jgi:hypothetical protein
VGDENARSGKDIELIDIGIYLHISGQFAEYAHIQCFSAGYDDIDRLIFQRFDATVVELRALVYDSSKGEYPAAIHPDCGGSLVLERYLKDFKHNEEVIMQIRKKEE